MVPELDAGETLKQLAQKVQFFSSEPEFNKLKVLRYILSKPCFTASELSRKLKIPRSAVYWHLQKFRSVGLITSILTGNKRVYFLKYVVKPAHIPIITSCFQHEQKRKIFDYVLANEGSRIKDISTHTGLPYNYVAKTINKLTDGAELFTAVSQGRERWISVSGEVKLLLTRFPSRKKLLLAKENIMSALTRYGLKPKLHRMRDDTLYISIHFREQNYVVPVILNPFRKLPVLS